MMELRFLLLLILLSIFLQCQSPSASNNTAQNLPLPDCEWCGAMDAPTQLSSTLQIAGLQEPGERLLITGTVFQADGVTPAPNILLYAYHTNQAGIYAKKGNETGNGRRHGHLRGWLKTDALGHYRIETIRPGSYPSRKEPAHIHLTLSGPNLPEYWLPSIVFADDPLLDDQQQAMAADGSSFSPVLHLIKNKDGSWQGRYDIILKKP